MVSPTTVIPSPRETLVHKWLRYSPTQRRKERHEGTDSEQMYKHLPHHWWASEYIKPVLNYADNALKDEGLISIIKDLDAVLVGLRKDIKTAGTDAEKDAILNKAKDTIHDFSDNIGNQKKFANLEKTLIPLSKEIAAQPTVKYGSGKAGLDQDQKRALQEQIDHYIALAKLAQNPTEMVKQYERNYQRFCDFGNQAAGISGGMQLFTQYAADADLNIEVGNRGELRGWRPSPKGLLSTGFGLLGDIKTTGIFNTNLKGRPNTFKRNLDEGDGQDGIMGGPHGLYEQFTHMRDRRYRDIKNGHARTKLRVVPVIKNRKGPNNAERHTLYGILSLYAAEEKSENGAIKDDRSYSDKMAEQMFAAWRAGFTGDALTAFRILCQSKGRSGHDRNPKGLMAAMDRQFKAITNDDPANHPDFGDFKSAASEIPEKSEHSNVGYGERHTLQICSAGSKFIFMGTVSPYQEVVGTPAKRDQVAKPLTYFWKSVQGKLTGGHVVEKERIDPDNGQKEHYHEVDYRWLTWWPQEEKLDEDGKKTGDKKGNKIWHSITNAPTPVQFLLNWGNVAVPIALTAFVNPNAASLMLFTWPVVKSGQFAWDKAIKPLHENSKYLTKKLFAIPALVAVAGVGISTISEIKEGITGTNSDLDIGRHITDASLNAYDGTVLLAARAVLRGPTWLINSISDDIYGKPFFEDPHAHNKLSLDWNLEALNNWLFSDVGEIQPFKVEQVKPGQLNGDLQHQFSGERPIILQNADFEAWGVPSEEPETLSEDDLNEWGLPLDEDGSEPSPEPDGP